MRNDIRAAEEEGKRALLDFVRRTDTAREDQDGLRNNGTVDLPKRAQRTQQLGRKIELFPFGDHRAPVARRPTCQAFPLDIRG